MRHVCLWNTSEFRADLLARMMLLKVKQFMHVDPHEKAANGMTQVEMKFPANQAPGLLRPAISGHQ